MVKPVQVVWFENNLRTQDHQGLAMAQKHPLPIIGVYVLEEAALKKTKNGFQKVGPYRLQFIDEALNDLKTSLSVYRIPLIVFIRSAVDGFKTLYQTFNIQTVYYEKAYGDEERHRHENVIDAFSSIDFVSFNTKSLYHEDDLPFVINNLASSFTAFRKTMEKSGRIREPLSLHENVQEALENIPDDLPRFKTLYTPCKSMIKGGEKEGLKRLNYYLFTSKKVSTYKETRNGMDEFDDSSKLSAYLALGCLSPRNVYQQLKQYEKRYGANESTYWLYFELLWRDYFHFLHVRYRSKFFFKQGLYQRDYQPITNQTYLDAWIKGKTGYPLIDANMKEIYQTGYMSNRGRQNVASFFCHYLKLDWRIGAEYFESLLIDYDVSSNYGNWLYQAGLGVDPRGTRIFNVIEQGKRYDPTTAYLVKWLPVLEALPIKERYHGKMAKSDAQLTLFATEIDYPEPIVKTPKL